MTEKDFIDHINHLYNLSESRRNHRTDWKHLIQVLKRLGNYKQRPGGRPFTKKNEFRITKEYHEALRDTENGNGYE